VTHMSLDRAVEHRMQPTENVMINHRPAPAVCSSTRAIAPRAVGVVVMLTLAFLPLAGGCSRYREDEWSKQWPRRVPAGGMVEFDGKPVEDAAVVFVTRGADGKKEYAALGRTDKAGKFRLTTFRPRDGAIVGKHLVGIEKFTAVPTKPIKGLAPEDQPTAERNVLPEKYRVYSTSGLEAEVTEKGPNEFVFRLDH
jgi:hypothetical protein